MKRPYYNQQNRLFLRWHRDKTTNTLLGAKLELHLAWMKFKREIYKSLGKFLWKR